MEAVGTMVRNSWDFDPVNEPLGKLVYERTYSRKMEDGRLEQWNDTVKRVVKGNLSLVSSKFIEKDEEEKLTYLLLNRIAIPGGRHLWASGTNSYALSNCFRAGFDKGFQAHCAFVFNQLMLGGGVGANYSSSYFADMPAFLSRIVPRFLECPDHEDWRKMKDLCLFKWSIDDPIQTLRVVVEDSREGWVHALEQLIYHSIYSTSLTILFDVSQVRCEGSPIRGFGGTAAGPMPLMLMLQKVAKLIDKQRGKCPDPLFAMEVDHQIATCVVAGNVRRSARMSTVHWKDPHIFEFINCKTDSLKHWSTNISVEIDQEFLDAIDANNPHAQAVLDAVVKGMLTNGEPGFLNTYLASEGEHGDIRSTNPCGEIFLENWEDCRLGHVNLAKGTDEERQEAFRLMTRFLLRTTFAPMQDSKQREVVHRNRRIGVGFFGLQEWMASEGMSYAGPDDHMTALAKHLIQWKATARAAADRYAEEMGIPRPIKVTTVAPTGSIAKLAGTTEGVQPIYARHFIRRVRYASKDPGIPTQWPMEPCIYTSGTTVVSVPCEDPVVARQNGNAHFLVDAAELSSEHALRLQVVIQKYYADNAISHTINLPQGTSPDILREQLIRYLPQLKGTTIMVDDTRPQQPYQRISEGGFKTLSIKGFESTQNEEDACHGACPVR